MTTAAAIDIGSNGVRLAIGTRTHERTIEVIDSWREPVRLGRDVFSHGDISEDTATALERALGKFLDQINTHKIESVRCVGTSALREAKNQKQIIKRIKKATGLVIEPIPAEEEARLVFLAVCERSNLGSDPAILVDIGGGSIEFSYVENREMLWSESAPMGAVRMLQLFESRNLSAKHFNRLVREYARGIRQQFSREHSHRDVRRCFGTGGNIEALGQLRKIICGAEQTDKITTVEIGEVLERLQSLNVQERVEKLGLRPDRADVIFPATAVIHQLLLEAEIDELQIPSVGLKDGLLLELLRETAPPSDARRQALFDYGLEVGRRYNFDEPHGRTVAWLAKELFHQTQSLHKLDSSFSLYLELAALLHDIGQFISYNGHHKHTYYLLTNAPFVGLLPREQQLVASIARYHRKSPPKPQHPSFSALDFQDREPVRKLSAILRVADALDRQHQSCVQEISVTVSDFETLLKIRGQGDMLLESWAAKKKADMFEDVFQTELSVEGAALL